MKKILMLKGLPGSGKSTWAKMFVEQNPGWVRVNKDSLRDMTGGYKPSKEDYILHLRDVAIQVGLDTGKNVIVDDTNLHPKHEARLKYIASEQQAEFEVKFFDVPLDQCIKNDLNRPVSVGERVIRKMWKDFLYQKYKAPEFDPSLPNALICDLDGTLCIHNDRSPYDTDKCDTDLRNDVVTKLLWWWKDIPARLIIFVSGREEKFRAKTEAWLIANVPFVTPAHLYMRPTGDFRKDDLVKEEIYLTKIMGRFNIGFVMDDRNRVVDMWRRNGLTCLQVAEGDF